MCVYVWWCIVNTNLCLVLMLHSAADEESGDEDGMLAVVC